MAYQLSVYPRFAAPAPPGRPRLRFWALPWNDLAFAFVLLGLSGASVGLALSSFAAGDLTRFFSANVLIGEHRAPLFWWLVSGVAIAIAVPILGLIFSRGRIAPWVIRTGDRYCPLIVTGFLPPLFDVQAWTGKTLVYLVLLTGVSLLCERLVSRSLTTFPALFRWGADGASAEVAAPSARWSRLRRYLPLAFVIAASVGYVVYFSHYTLMNHRRFGTTGFDLGINVNWCYNALHGHLFRSTVLHGPDGGNFLAGHAIFAMFFWLPLYALMPGPEILLIYQSFMCGIAAIPLYLFAKELLPRFAAVAIALGYLMFAPLHGPNFYDYHELPVALPFHFLLHYSILKKRYKWAALFVVMLIAHREDVPVGLAVLGLFLVLTGLRPKFGFALSIVSVIAFIGIKFVLMPWAGPWFFAEMLYGELQPPATEGYGAVIQTILTNPAFFLNTLLKEPKLIYVLHLLAPLLFLPMRRAPLALLALPGFFFTLMTTNYAPTVSIAFQYTAHWIPYIFLASILSLKLLRDHFGAARQWGAVAAIGLAILSHSTLYGAVIQHETFVGGFFRIQFQETSEDRKLYADFRKLAALIPQEASVAATEREVPHVAVRMNVYTLNAAHGDADYLLLRRGEFNRQLVLDAFRRNSYGLVDRVGSTFYLFKKNHTSPQTQQARRELGIP